MVSDKFRKLLNSESKLKEAKKICENAGYKVRSKAINESKYLDVKSVSTLIKSNAKYLSDVNDKTYGKSLCNIIETCADGLKYFPEEYIRDSENSYEFADKIDDIMNAVSELQDMIDEL